MGSWGVGFCQTEVNSGHSVAGAQSLGKAGHITCISMECNHIPLQISLQNTWAESSKLLHAGVVPSFAYGMGPLDADLSGGLADEWLCHKCDRWPWEWTEQTSICCCLVEGHWKMFLTLKYPFLFAPVANGNTGKPMGPTVIQWKEKVLQLQWNVQSLSPGFMICLHILADDLLSLYWSALMPTAGRRLKYCKNQYEQKAS